MNKSTSFRLSDNARAILSEQSETLSISQNSILEILLRQKFGSLNPDIRTASLIAFHQKHDYKLRHSAPDAIWHAGFAAGWYAAQAKRRETK